MKIKPEHREYIKIAIMGTGNAATWPIYKQAGLSYQRWLWDVLHSANIGSWLNSNIYSYANDANIETILRSILGSEPGEEKNNGNNR